ncbi:MAG: hypothetical protein C0524_17910 [Rhodobacter sp.]|nr:hypothetical protein [Rhodobacter sp.]
MAVARYTHAGLPFGGVNTSGLGSVHGEHGFRAFSHDRAMPRNRLLLLPLLFQPYGPRAKRLLGVLKRLLGQAFSTLRHRRAQACKSLAHRPPDISHRRASATPQCADQPCRRGTFGLSSSFYKPDI